MLNFRTHVRLCFLIAFLSSTCAFAQQCRHWNKKVCNKYIFDQYVGNGQYSSAELLPGETAELQMVTYHGHDYQVTMCSEEILGELEWKIVSTDGEVLFDNKQEEMTQQWSFSIEKSKRLTVVVKAPGSGGGNSDEFTEAGCATVLIGHRKTPKSGFH